VKSNPCASEIIRVERTLNRLFCTIVVWVGACDAREGCKNIRSVVLVVHQTSALFGGMAHSNDAFWAVVPLCCTVATQIGLLGDSFW
jgi:hypothetical protein